MAITVNNAVKRFLAHAERLREDGNWTVAHEYQTKADEIARLGDQAERLPPLKKKR